MPIRFCKPGATSQVPGNTLRRGRSAAAPLENPRRGPDTPALPAGSP